MAAKETSTSRQKLDRASFSHLTVEYVRVNTLFMLSPDPHFDYHFVAYLKDDPAQEPIAIGYSIPRILADTSEKTGRPRSDFEVQEISKERYEKLQKFL